MIRQHLEEWVKMLARLRPDCPGRYLCGEEFVLKNGREYIYQPLPKPLKYGPMKMCFRNAFYLADERGLIYTEGYATCKPLGLPVLHAWCVNEDNVVFDPTWRDGDEYFGVAFSMKYVRRTILAREKFGVIDNLEEHFPLLMGKHKRFRYGKGE